MAAILCKPITSCLEFVCTAPCKLCAGGCKLCSDGIAGFCTNPLATFITVTFLTQAPLAIAAAMEVVGLLNCQGSQWLVGMLGVAISHMVTSVYLAHRVTNRTDEALRDKHTSWERISYLLCHDPWIALYLLIVLFDVVWLVIGSMWSLGGSMDDDASCGSGVFGNVRIALGLGWFYLILGPSVLSCNLCCVCCDKKDYAADDEEFATQQAMKESKKEAKKKQKQTSAAAASSHNAYAANDIESNPPPPMPQPQTKAAPRVYSVEGVEIPDDGNDHVVEAEVVIDSETLPPPMAPPQSAKQEHQPSKQKQVQSKAEELAAKAQATGKMAAKSVNDQVGGWFKKKKKKGDTLPDQKASIY